MKNNPGFIPAHGNYRELLSYQKAEIVYDFTYRFCQRFLGKLDRTNDQMIQAARSGKQNIVEGSRASGTSKETEIKLFGVARAEPARQEPRPTKGTTAISFACVLFQFGKRRVAKPDL